MLRAKCQFLLCGAKRAYANNDLIDCVTTLRCHTVASGGPSTSIIIRIYEQVWCCSPPTCFPWHSLVICESMFDRFWRPDDQAFKRINLHQAQLPTICQKKRDTQAFFVGLTTRELETMWYFWASVPFFLLLFLMRNRTRDSWKNKFWGFVLFKHAKVWSTFACLIVCIKKFLVLMAVLIFRNFFLSRLFAMYCAILFVIYCHVIF